MKEILSSLIDKNGISMVIVTLANIYLDKAHKCHDQNSIECKNFESIAKHLFNYTYEKK